MIRTGRSRSFLWETVEERLQQSDQRREVRLDGVSEDLLVDPEVFVNDNVPHIAHIGPRDLG
jgi:hypothetical protein